MPTTHNTRRILFFAAIPAAIVAGALVGAAYVVWSDSQEPTQPSSPAAAAGEFAAAYAAGDTEAACRLTVGKARESMQGDGLCDRAGGWNVTYKQARSCEVPTRGTGFLFDTGSEIGRDLGFEIVVAGTEGTYLVTELHNGGGRSYCDIYGGGG